MSQLHTEWERASESAQRRTETALATRLRQAAPFLLDNDLPETEPDPAADAARTLDALVRSVVAAPAGERIWLLLIALTAAYPRRERVDDVRRLLELHSGRTAVIALLEDALLSADVASESEATMDVVVGGVVVDVDHTAKFDLHTGIQRVSRSLLPRWDKDHQIFPAAWTASGSSLRHLGTAESARVLRWERREVTRTADLNQEEMLDSPPPRLLVPWRSVVVMVEVPSRDACDRLACLGDRSGNRLVGVAHDAIPVVSADMVPSEDSSKFVRYLTCVKFAARMAGVSASATSEMRGFVRALKTQGLRGPTVIEVPLGSPTPPRREPANAAHGNLDVLVVGSHEPRKNHLAVLHSAETLWRSGLRFTLTFIGGSGWGDEFPRRVAELEKAGRPIRVRRAVSEPELERAYATAGFTVFPSLHEGFGLPVVESLAHGTPVITSNFGSTAETAAGGGTLLVDPRDDDSLTAAMRSLLGEPALLERLRGEIARRPHRTWQDYADELWERLVEPEQRALDSVQRVENE